MPSTSAHYMQIFLVNFFLFIFYFKFLSPKEIHIVFKSCNIAASTKRTGVYFKRVNFITFIWIMAVQLLLVNY